MLSDSKEDAQEWINSMKSAQEYAMSTTLLTSEWKKTSMLKNLLKTDSVFDSQIGYDVDSKSFVAISEKDDCSILNLDVEDSTGVIRRLDEIIGDKLVFVVLFRQYGCLSARQFAIKLQSYSDILEELGVQLIAVGCGSVEGTSKFKKEFSFPGEFLTDKNRSLYNKIGCRRGIKYVLSLKSLNYYKKAASEGVKSSSVDGDILQLGGAFLYARHTGIMYKHLDSYIEQHLNFNEITHMVWAYQRDNPDTAWGALPNLDLGIFSTISDANESLDGRAFHLERGYKYSNKKDIQVLNFDFFQRLFQDYDHDIWVRKLPSDYVPDGDEIGPVIIMIKKEMNSDRSALVFHKKETTRRYIYASRGSSEKDYVKYLSIKLFSKELPLIKVNPSAILEDLINYEQKCKYNEFKFGVLYARDGEVLEEEIYSHKPQSPDFEEFLDVIGETVRLKNMDGYLGGLDNKADRTGTHSVYTKFKNNDIMFHVATMIPRDSSDPTIAQKRHIGNDVIVIIFQEGQSKINLTDFQSQFNHVFAIVNKITVETKKSKSYRYKVQFVYKPGVPPSPPFLYDPPYFEIGKPFRKFFLSKLINLENMITVTAPIFKSKMSKVRDDILMNISVKAMRKENRNDSSSRNSPRAHYIESPPSSFKKLKKEPSSNDSSPMRLKLVNHNDSPNTSKEKIQYSPSQRRKTSRSHSDKANSKSEIKTEDPRRQCSEIIVNNDHTTKKSDCEPQSSKLEMGKHKEQFGQIRQMWVNIVSENSKPNLASPTKGSTKSRGREGASLKRRIIIVNKDCESENDIIPIDPTDTLEILIQKVSKEMGKKIEQLLFSDVVLRPKHVDLLQDRDKIYVIFKK